MKRKKLATLEVLEREYWSEMPTSWISAAVCSLVRAQVNGTLKKKVPLILVGYRPGSVRYTKLVERFSRYACSRFGKDGP